MVAKILGRVFEHFGSLLLDAAKHLFAEQKLAFATASALVVVSLALGGWSLVRANRYQRLLEAAISKNTENTPQTLKALESLILGYAETDSSGAEIPFKKNVETATLSQEFLGLLNEANNVFAGEPALSTAALTPSTVNPSPHDAVITETAQDPATRIGFLFLPARLIQGVAALGPLGQSHVRSTVATAASPQRCEMTAAPAPATRPAATSPIGAGTSALLVDTRLCDDIFVTHALAATLVAATKAKITSSPVAGLDLRPKQAYVITENGINRIVSQDAHDADYASKFNATLVFQARPYYLGAVKKGKALGFPPLGGAPVIGMAVPVGGDGGYFYVSEPYLDIGGYGIVITVARAFSYPKHSDGVIAFDLAIEGVDDRLQAMTEDLGGSWFVTRCHPNTSPQAVCDPTSGDQTLYQDVKPLLEADVTQAWRNHTSSDVAGNMFLVSMREPKSILATTAGNLPLMLSWLSSWVAHPSKEIRFTIPLDASGRVGATRGTGAPSPPGTPKDQDAFDLLVVSLNIGQYLQTTAVGSAVALFLFGVAMTVAIGALATTAKLREAAGKEKAALQAAADQRRAELDAAAAQEQAKLHQAALKERQDLEDALRNVAGIMMSVNVPYVRLDNDDRIIDANNALAIFLGVPATRDAIKLRIIHTRFEDWISVPSRREYNRVQRLRKLGESVDPYDLTFERDDRTTATARIVSSVVPASQLAFGGLPETFGVLVVASSDAGGSLR